MLPLQTVSILEAWGAAGTSAGTDAYERYTELDALLKEYIAELERLLRATAAE